MRHCKKFLAVSLIASMVMGSSAVAFAADQRDEASGTGNVEYVAKGDVFNVVFPTVPEDSTMFDYIVDPDGLIAKTSADKYGNKTFEAGQTLYFARSTDSNATTDYTHDSDELTVTNKSTQAINLVVNAKVAAVEGITMATSSDALVDQEDGATTPILYLAVSGKGTDDAAAAEEGITTDGLVVENTVDADDNAYTVVWNSTEQQYEKALTTAAAADGYTGFKSYTFQLTGACNKHEGWTALEGKAPSVDLIWSVDDFTVSGPQVTMGKDGVIKITNLEGMYQTFEMKVGSDSYTLSSKSGTWTAWEDPASGKKEFKLGSGWYPTWISGKTATAVLTLKDGTVITSKPVTFD